MRKAIAYKTAQAIAKQLDLEYSSSFSNPFPSELCHEYRMETGMAFKNSGCDDLLNFVITKDEKEQFVYTAILSLRKSSFGIRDEEDMNDGKKVAKAKKLLSEFNRVSGYEYTLGRLE